MVGVCRYWSSLVGVFGMDGLLGCVIVVFHWLGGRAACRPPNKFSFG